MLKKFIAILVVVLSVATAHAQTWLRNFSYNSSPYVFVFDDTHGGLVTMQKTDTATNVTHNFLLHVSPKGDSLWTKPIADSETIMSIAGLSGGGYVVGSITDALTGNYVIRRLDSTGNFTGQRIIFNNTFNAAPGSYSYFNDANSPKLIADHHNNYYLLYDLDSSSVYWYTDPVTFQQVYVDSAFNRTYIEKYNAANTLLWRKKDEIVWDGSAPGSHWNYTRMQPGSAILTENDGLLVGKDTAAVDADKMRYYYKKIDANGNILWSKNAGGYLQRGDSSLYYEAYLNQTLDSNYTVLYEIYSYDTNTYASQNVKQELVKLYSNGGLMKNITADSINNLGLLSYLDVGTETSTGNYLMPSVMYYDTLGNATLGITTYDKNLNFVSYTPQPMPLYQPTPYGYGYLANLIPNKMGGAFCAFPLLMNNAYYYTTVCNFDSLFNLNAANITGRVIQDNNTNCTTDAGDYKMKNSVITVTAPDSTTWYAITDTGGNYKVNVPDNTYAAIHTARAYRQSECPTTGVLNYTLTGNTTITNATFYDKLTPNINDLVTSVYSSHFVPGFAGYLNVQVSNVGTTVASTTLTVELDPSITFASSVPAPSAISGNTLSYSISALNLDSVANVQINVNTPATLSLGTPLRFTASALLLFDNTLGNNSDTLITTVVGSFDPNEKSVNRPYDVIPGKEMIYTVEFQNTGTYPAKNVVVVDTISPMLDMSTFRLISGSPALPMVSTQEGKRLVFNFKNINLPDKKANEPASHGKFTYSVMSKKTLHIGDTINNTAYIYFDFNSAVVTNTATNVISHKTQLSVPVTLAGGADLQLYPNPTGGNIHIVVPPIAGDRLITVTDIAGRIIYSQTVPGNMSDIACNVVATSGLYLVKVTNMLTGEATVKKLVIRN